jgi:hypothetical protein
MLGGACLRANFFPCNDYKWYCKIYHLTHPLPQNMLGACGFSEAL